MFEDIQYSLIAKSMLKQRDFIGTVDNDKAFRMAEWIVKTFQTERVSIYEAQTSLEMAEQLLKFCQVGTIEEK